MKYLPNENEISKGWHRCLNETDNPPKPIIMTVFPCMYEQKNALAYKYDSNNDKQRNCNFFIHVSFTFLMSLSEK